MNLVIADAIMMLGNFLIIMIFARVIMSWIPFDRDGFGGKIYGFASLFTEPIISPIRKLIQRSPLGGGGMMIDFSPMLAFFAIRMVTFLLADFLRGL